MCSITQKNTSFLSTALTASSAQELLDQLQEAAKQEMAYWTGLLSEAPDRVKMYKLIQHCMSALNHESSAAKEIANAIQAEASGLIAEASVYYHRAHSDLGFAFSDWHFAVPEVADDSPFDTYMPTTAERKQYEKDGYPRQKQPTRISYTDLLEISPMLHHIYVSMDRVHCLGLSLTQFQMAHLSTCLIEAEHRSAAYQIKAKAEQQA
ncbi:MAG: hypothetical protein ACRDHW_02770 [Ktedonobacteraceae bacterium]